MDTICSISTAQGEGAISIIRISGQDSILIANKIFKGTNLETKKSHTIHYGHIIDNNKNVIDEVLLSIMLSPRTFTTEDTIEIQCHGGSFVTNKVLETVLINGARLAEPGEFTKRAFLNGRIDLAKAESVMDIIKSKSQMSLDSANANLNGRTTTLINDLREDLINIIADIEVNIDYPEYDEVGDISEKVVKPKIVTLNNKIENILKSSNKGKLIREGIDVAIIGKPNVGKSSLLNLLLEEDKAIVTDIEGTTRDVIEGQIVLGGILINIIDTAGIRKTTDVVESIGVEKSKEYISKADLVLLLIDASVELSKEDKELLELTKSSTRIIVLTKTDKNIVNTFSDDHIKVSNITEEGLNALEDLIIVKSGLLNIKDQSYLSNTRHIAKLNDVKSILDDALNAINNSIDIDLINIDLHNAWNTLGEIIGVTHKDGVIDELFSKFCLGK